MNSGQDQRETYIRINAAKWRTAIVVHGLVSRRWRLHRLLWLTVLSLVEGLLVDGRDWSHGSGRRRCGRLFAICCCRSRTCIRPFLVCGLLQSTSMLLKGGAESRNFTLLSLVGFFFGLAVLVCDGVGGFGLDCDGEGSGRGCSFVGAGGGGICWRCCGWPMGPPIVALKGNYPGSGPPRQPFCCIWPLRMASICAGVICWPLKLGGWGCELGGRMPMGPFRGMPWG